VETINIFSLIGLGLIAAVMAVVLRAQRPEFSMLISIGAAALILGGVIAGMLPVMDHLRGIFDITDMPAPYIQVLFKALGLCFVTQIACDTCKDAGETAIGSKIEMAGKIAVLIVSLPLFTQVLNIVRMLLN